MKESDPIQDLRTLEREDVRPLALKSLREALRPIRRRQRKGLWTSVSDVHQGRVEIRRMRATLGLFASLLEPEKSEQLQRKLRRVVRILGPVRDLDVLVERSLRWALPRRGEAVVQLIYQISSERERLVTAILPKLAVSNDEMLLKVGRRIFGEKPHSGSDWRRKLASGILAELQMLGSPLESDALVNSEMLERLHERRKRCRHLRYQLEFLQPLTAADLGVRFFREAQMRLGRVHDAAVIHAWFLGEWRERVGRKLQSDILAWEEAELGVALQELAEFWHGAEGWARAKASVEHGLSSERLAPESRS